MQMNIDYAQYSALGRQHQFWDGERLKEVANAPVNTPAEISNTPANKIDLVCLERLQLNSVTQEQPTCHHHKDSGEQ